VKKIARITTQKKRANRYNIFLSDGKDEYYAFAVDEAVLIEFGLRKGLELDDESIQAITQKEELHKFYTQSINYLSYRMRTKQEIRDYLAKKEVAPNYIDYIVKRLTKEKLLDDKEFAIAFVQSRINTSSKGPKLIEQELREKGVSPDFIAEALESYSKVEQFDKTYKWMEKKLRQSSKHAFRKRMDQLKMNLMQKGFDRSVIEEVAAEFTHLKQEDEEWDAILYQGEKLIRKYQRKFSGFELENKVKAALYQKGFSFDHIDRFLEERLQEE
jgi:regulatory protein